MTRLHDVLAAARRPAPPPAAAVRRRVIVAGGAGALGAAVLEALLASEQFAQVSVVVTQTLNVALRGLSTVDDATLQRPPAAGGAEELAVIVFDRIRHANGREAAFLRPEPGAMLPIATRLRARGVRDLVVVMPHAPATLPDALKQGLANVDEQAAAALAFEHLVIVRSAHAPPRVRSASVPQRLADWVLSQLHLMIPQRDKPVRAARIAAFVAAVAARLHDAPGGTRIVPPETVWEAAHANDPERFAAESLR